MKACGSGALRGASRPRRRALDLAPARASSCGPTFRAALVARAGQDAFATRLEDPIRRSQQVVEALGEPVVDLAPSPLALDQTAVPQTREVLRDVRLREARDLREIADAAIAAPELFDQSEPARVRQAVEQDGTGLGRYRHRHLTLQTYVCRGKSQFGYGRERTVQVRPPSAERFTVPSWRAAFSPSGSASNAPGPPPIAPTWRQGLSLRAAMTSPLPVITTARSESRNSSW